VPPGKLLIAGTGRESTRATIDACRRAGALGADAVLVRPPSYYKTQMTSDALLAHFRRVADASPVPVLLYNLPATGVILTVPVVAALADHPNIVGMKETSSELERLGQCTAIGGGFAVFCGWAPVIYPAVAKNATILRFTLNARHTREDLDYTIETLERTFRQLGLLEAPEPTPRALAARAVVLTAGTFLAGLIHVGQSNYQAGRMGDPPGSACATGAALGFFVNQLMADPQRLYFA
jgi:hypothetical protein